jgi:Tol biopolymer transport system component
MLRLWISVALVLTALFAIATLALSREWEAATESVSWQVVFSSSAIEIGFGAFITDMNGETIRPLSLGGIQLTSPACSPDGSYLAFTVRETLSILNTGSARELWQWSEPTYAHLLTVSRDGRTAVLSGALHYAGDTQYGMWIIETTPFDFIIPSVQALRSASSFDLSPDGKQIVFQSQEDDLYLVNADESDMRLLVANAADPDWSPDGSMIAFSANWDGAFNIYIMDVSRRLWAQVTYLEQAAPNGGNVEPSWSPDSNQISFISLDERRSRLGNLYLIRADGSGQRHLLNAPPVTSACILRTRPVLLTADS